MVRRSKSRGLRAKFDLVSGRAERTSEMKSVDKADLDAIVLRLRDEFIVEAEGNLARMAALLTRLGDGIETGSDALRLIRQGAHSLKGSGKTYGFPLITVVSHRLEGYLSGLDRLAGDDIAAVRQLVDALGEVLAGGDGNSDEHAATLLRGLPVRTGVTFDDHAIDRPPVSDPD